MLSNKVTIAVVGQCKFICWQLHNKNYERTWIKISESFDLPILSFNVQLHYNTFFIYFDREFLDDYLELLKRRFGKKRVHCNIVYQEYISHREHVHMNSTQWETLTEFVKWLGREGKDIKIP